MFLTYLIPLFTSVAMMKWPGPDELVSKDLAKGKGYAAQNGDVLTVVYKGTLADGKVFDSSEKKPPFAFVLGKKQVITGWDEGLKGAKVGTKRELTIPPSMGYGAEGYGAVPANATLKFNLEVLRIDKKGVKPKVEITELAPGIGNASKDGDTVEVEYRGLFLNGFEFDKGTFPAMIGGHQVILGFEQGITGLQVGGKRRVLIPYPMAYGINGQPPTIPRYATLIFEIELKSIKH